MTTYRNNKTGQSIETDGPQPVFDRSPQWDLVAALEADDTNESSGGYGDQSPEDLAALATERGLEITGSGLNGRVLKKDLVAALEADDTNESSGGYGDQSPEDLAALATERGLEITGSGLNGRVLKKDLVAALEADDTK